MIIFKSPENFCGFLYFLWVGIMVLAVLILLVVEFAKKLIRWGAKKILEASKMSRNQELELYKLIITPDETDTDVSYVQEVGWVNEKEFCVWVSYIWLREFIERLKEIFGDGLFDDGGFDANMQDDCVCIDLCEAVGYAVDIEEIFPKEKYRH